MRGFVGIVIICTVGCGGGGGSECPVGTEGCECSPGGVCDGDLVCEGGVCTMTDTSTDSVEDPVEDTPVDSPAETACTLDGDCDDGDPCTTDTCDTDSGDCSNLAVDADGDGYPAAQVGEEDCGGTDCDDDRADTYPGADEVCSDGVDQDCDGTVDGLMLIGSNVAVTSLTGNSYPPDIVWTGSEYGLAYSDAPAGDREIYFTTVSAGGVPSGTQTRITTSSANTTECELAWTGSSYGLVWGDTTTTVHFLVMNPAGTAIGSVVDPIAGIAQSPHVAWSGSVFGVVASQHTWAAEAEVGASVLDETGARVGSDLRLTHASGVSANVQVAWTGSEFVGVWKDERDYFPSGGGIQYDIYMGKFSDAGATLGSDIRITSNAFFSQSPSVAWSGSELGISWTEHAGFWEVYFARVTTDGVKIGSDTRLTDETNGNYDSTIIWAADQWFVAWHEAGDPTDVFMISVTGDGVVNGSKVSVTSSIEARYPALAWSGSQLAISWEDRTSDRIGFALYEFCE